MKRLLLLVPMVALLMGADNPKRAPSVPPPKVTADAIRISYSDNAADADGTFLHKYLQVAGVISRITRELSEELVPTMDVPGRTLKTIPMYVVDMEHFPKSESSPVRLRFFFRPDYREDLAALRVGTPVTITGFCMGILGSDVKFSNCKLAPLKGPKPEVSGQKQ